MSTRTFDKGLSAAESLEFATVVRAMSDSASRVRNA